MKKFKQFKDFDQLREAQFWASERGMRRSSEYWIHLDSEEARLTSEWKASKS